MIYPLSKKYILNPVVVTTRSGEEILKYFLFETKSGKLYEWTYFTENPPITDKENKGLHYGVIAMKELNTITKWNFSFNSLDDENFWSKFVFRKK